MKVNKCVNYRRKHLVNVKGFTKSLVSKFTRK